MLKHVQLSPSRSRGGADTSSSSSADNDNEGEGDALSLRSLRASCYSLSLLAPRSRCSSYSSLSEAASSTSSSSSSSSSSCMRDVPSTTIKVYARCLRPDIEYKTLAVSYETTARQVVSALLNKCRVRHRDPNLFSLTLEVVVAPQARTILALDDDARPAALMACQPRGLNGAATSRLALRARDGGLLKVYDGAVSPGSQYKSLLVAERTTTAEVLRLLRGSAADGLSLFEESCEHRRRLRPDEAPLRLLRARARAIRAGSHAPETHLVVRRADQYYDNYFYI